MLEIVRHETNCTVFEYFSVVISKEHPVSGGGGVSGSRFNVRDG